MLQKWLLVEIRLLTAKTNNIYIQDIFTCPLKRVNNTLQTTTLFFLTGVVVMAVLRLNWSIDILINANK